MAERVISYAVEWQTNHKPGVWELYSAYYTDPAKVVSSYEAIQGMQGVLNTRIMQRVVTRSEISLALSSLSFCNIGANAGATSQKLFRQNIFVMLAYKIFIKFYNTNRKRKTFIY